MNPAIVQLVALGIEELIKDAPSAIVAFRELFAKPNPTPEDWNALRQKLVVSSYADYVPDTKIPK